MSADKLLVTFNTTTANDLVEHIKNLESERDSEFAEFNSLIEVARRLLDLKRASAGQAPEVVLTNVCESAAAPSRSMEKRLAAQEKPMPTDRALRDRIEGIMSIFGPHSVAKIAHETGVHESFVTATLRNDPRFIEISDDLWDLKSKVEAKQEERKAAPKKPKPTLSPLVDRIATFLDYSGPSSVGAISANILVDRDVVAKALENNSRFVQVKDGLWDLESKIEAKQGN